MTVSYGSLCTGYEGIGLGLSELFDLNIRWQCENDKHASKILATRFPGVPNLDDLTTVDWTTVEPVELLSAGYPCQPFSHAGKRKGTDDERHIWPHIARAIGVLRPRRVLLENVDGHLSMGLDVVVADLAALGYDATWCVVRAADVGAPHRRARIFILASDTRRERHGRREDRSSLGRLDGADEGTAPQRQRPRAESVDRGAAAAANAGDRPGVSERAREESGQGGAPAPDASGAGWRPSGRSVGGAAKSAGTSGRSAGSRQGSVADPASDRRDEGRPEPTRVVRRSDAAIGGDDTSSHPDRIGSALVGRQLTVERDTDRRNSEDIAWGIYEPAIRRWERVTGRDAPRPTEPGPNGKRLSPRLPEWMMGLPAGWVTDVDITRNEKLKALGNGVVPQQCAAAARILFDLEQVAA